MNINELIRSKINDFQTQSIDLVDGTPYSQYQTIKRITLYLLGKFENNVKYFGIDKVFFNISSPAKDILAEKINTDTKDIRTINLEDKSWWSSFLVNQELKDILTKLGFAKKLNEIGETLATYGSAFLWETKDDVQVVDLRNFWCDQGVNTIHKSSYILKKDSLSIDDLEEMKGKWDSKAVQNVIDNINYYNGTSVSYKDGYQKLKQSGIVDIYSFIGYVPESYLKEGGSEKPVKAFFVVAEPFAIDKDQNSYNEKGIVLFKSKWTKKYPIREFHLDKVAGRLLGLSPIEKLFPVQERMNELATQKRLSMELSSIHVFQKVGKALPLKNIREVEAGTVIATESPITPIANEERNLSAFQMEHNIYLKQRDDVTFSNDISRGGAFAATTPATNATIQDRNLASIFAYKKQPLLIELEEFMNDWMLKKIISEISKEHISIFSGDMSDLEKFDEDITEYRANAVMWERFFNGQEVTEEVESKLKDEIKSVLKKGGAKREILIKDILFKNVKLKLKIITSDESQDIATLMNNNMQFLTMLMSNPQSIDDPVIAEFIYSWAEKAGIPPVKIQSAIEKRNEMKSQMMEKESMLPQENQPNLQPNQPNLENQINK